MDASTAAYKIGEAAFQLTTTNCDFADYYIAQIEEARKLTGQLVFEVAKTNNKKLPQALVIHYDSGVVTIRSHNAKDAYNFLENYFHHA